MAVARSLVSHIKLVFIDPEQLKFTITKCGFVDPHHVEEVLKEIEVMLDNESPDDKERVIVEGAGHNRVNGVYVLAEDEVGLDADEVMFLKEGGDFSSDFGLYRWGERWSISNSIDYSNVLYSCAVLRRKGHSLRKPPKWGWKCAEGTEKAPTCTWKPSKEEENADTTKMGIVPRLAPNHEKASCLTHPTRAAGECSHGMDKSLTLGQMMSLPVDEDYSVDNHKYASMTKDLYAMMDMPVDEGHEDEEGGYDVNYLSATKFWNSTNLEDSAATKPS